MAANPPPYPPPGYDPREQRRFLRDQARAQRAAFRAQRDQMRYQMRSMRRGSILGPILLIAVGLIFLLIQTGHLDRNRFWEWYGHWWPFLLVGAGLVVLAEWAADQYLMRDPQRPPYRRSVGGGVVLLLLIFAGFGAVATQFHDYPEAFSHWFPGMHVDQDSLDKMFGDKHESDETLDLSYTQGSSLNVVNPRGSVTVSGTSDDNNIHLTLHKQVYSRSDSEADTKMKQFNPDNKYQNSVWTVTMPALDGASADLVITVPAAAAVTVNADHGDVHVASIKAAVTAVANHGDIVLSGITGPTTAHENSGGSSISAKNINGGIAIQGHAEDNTLADITGPVTITGEFFGTTHLEHINGSVHFHTSRTDFQLARLDGEIEISPDMNLTADQVLGPVVLTTRERNITLERVTGDVAVTNRNGTIELTKAAPIGNITIEDRNGSVRVTMPTLASFAVQANTTNGNIDTDFPLSTTGTENNRTLNGAVGGGGPLLHITTTNNDISIHKGEVQPLGAAPPPPPKITLTPPAAPAMPKTPKAPKTPPTPPPPNP
jgi:DUF4097 and DUF4098 domain-containing protein YvlB